MSEQLAFTAAHVIHASDADLTSVTGYLDDLGEDVVKQKQIDVSRLPMVHFFRWVVLPGTSGCPPQLLFECNHDDSADAMLQALIASSRAAIDRIYGICACYPGRAADPSAIRDFLQAGALECAAFYVAYPGRSARCILAERDLREVLEQFLDDVHDPDSPQEPEAIRKSAAAHVRSLAAALPAANPSRPGRAIVYLALAGSILMAVALSPLLLIGWLWLRHLERTDPQGPFDDDPDHVRRLAAREGIVVQNQLTHVVELKPGRFRRALCGSLLFAIGFLARHLFVAGKLGDIPSIHFARWVFLDRGQRLLFFSNYDGSWESYLGDFIDRASTGLTAIWSHTAGFPRTRNLIGEGALHEDNFKAWTRRHQVRTQFWYSAYPELTNLEIAANARIRSGLEGGVGAQEWLDLFDGGNPIPRRKPAGPDGGSPAEKLDRADIQGLALSGYGNHRYSEFLVLRFGERERAAAWLRGIAEQVASVADEHQRETIVNVALSHSGLELLGLGATGVRGFSREFVEGMAAGGRAQSLGDREESDPWRWRWGGPRNDPADALLLVYARGEATRDEAVARIRDALSESGIASVHDVRAEILDKRREHFGFVDALSQPLVRGFDPPGAGPMVAPGEFIFGYPNAYGESALPDLARNGTYLVARQLHQHVARFRKFKTDAALQLYGTAAAAEVVAAKCVGRWQDGGPLVLYPDAASNDITNEFGFAGDPIGFRCPITAHIRRANPRDSLATSAEESLAMAARHRILRRGRSYGAWLTREQDDGVERGLFFLCVNANIARQFEFIQQQWIENPKFGGLRSDRDPVLARPPTNSASTLTVPQIPVRGRVSVLAPFVTVRGGGYFFLPGIEALNKIAALANEGGHA